METLEKLRPLALLLLRAALGVIFIYHGYPKLHHASATMAMFSHLGFPRYFAVVSGVLETFGGGLLILGLFTRIVGLLLAGEMVIALWRVHGMFTNPMAVSHYEFPMALAASAFTLACLGAGAISMDHAIFRARGTARKAK
jgi:putative oxidoreductase